MAGMMTLGADDPSVANDRDELETFIPIADSSGSSPCGSGG
jgi:hypothetical protein